MNFKKKKKKETSPIHTKGEEITQSCEHWVAGTMEGGMENLSVTIIFYISSFIGILYVPLVRNLQEYRILCVLLVTLSPAPGDIIGTQ